MNDLISRQAAIDAHFEYCNRHPDAEFPVWSFKILEDLPPAQPETHEERTETHACDLIDRQQVLNLFPTHDWKHLYDVVKDLPSAQPERTCVNCGRTANNGGWYADGKTRCPIEEHYALPKDGYCHLWEKRNVTDDDYPERQKNE